MFLKRESVGILLVNFLVNLVYLNHSFVQKAGKTEQKWSLGGCGYQEIIRPWGKQTHLALLCP